MAKVKFIVVTEQDGNEEREPLVRVERVVVRGVRRDTARSLAALIYSAGPTYFLGEESAHHLVPEDRQLIDKVEDRDYDGVSYQRLIAEATVFDGKPYPSVRSPSTSEKFRQARILQEAAEAGASEITPRKGQPMGRKDRKRAEPKNDD